MEFASDESLIAGLAAGDRAAARALVRRFQTRVYGLALTMARDRAVADEIAQDAFVRAWRYGASYDPRRGTAAAWLLGITRNCAIDHLAARSRQALPLPVDVDELFGAHESGAGVDSAPAAIGGAGGGADHATAHADRDLVVGALRALPAEQRVTFLGAAFCGMTAREMSEAWGVPIGTVKTRLRLAVQKLRDSVTRAER